MPKLPLRRLIMSAIMMSVAHLLLLSPLAWSKPRTKRVPLSPADKRFRAVVSPAPQVYIVGVGMTWRHLTGLPGDGTHGFRVKDKATLRQLMQTLRCTSRVGHLTEDPQASITIAVPFTDPQTHQPDWTYFVYLRDRKGAYLEPTENGERGLWPLDAVVQPRSAPRFEAFVAKLAKRAQAPGHHPNLTLGTPPNRHLDD